jgi:hypothetical protein
MPAAAAPADLARLTVSLGLLQAQRRLEKADYCVELEVGVRLLREAVTLVVRQQGLDGHTILLPAKAKRVARTAA